MWSHYTWDTLDGNGVPAIDGTRKTTTGGWWWGIPSKAPKAKLAYELALFISTNSINALECSQFGMIPIRKDLLQNIQNVFQEGWVGDVYRTSFEQINSQISDSSFTIVPLDKEYPALADNYIEAWYDIVMKREKGLLSTEKSISDFLKAKYVPKAQSLYGSAYPAATAEKAQ